LVGRPAGNPLTQLRRVGRVRLLALPLCAVDERNELVDRETSHLVQRDRFVGSRRA
jgi:hypothetical protein